MIKDHYEMIRRNKMAFWWFAGRRDLFSSLLARYMPEPAVIAVDIGCGPGTNDSLYPLFGKRWVALDHSMESFDGCVPAPGSLPMLASVLAMPVKDGSAGLCLLLDVLEHIDDDKAALSEIAGTLSPGGILLISVPAFRCLWSRHDEQAGHKKRYRMREIEELAFSCGFEPAFTCYFNTSLFLPILLARKILKMVPGGKETLEMNLSPGFLDGALYWLLKMENFMNLTIFRLPFGTSCVALLRKK